MEDSVAPKPVTGTNYVQESPETGDPYKLCEPRLGRLQATCREAPKPATGTTYVQGSPETGSAACKPRPRSR